jgi:hypothetical protein
MLTLQLTRAQALSAALPQPLAAAAGRHVLLRLPAALVCIKTRGFGFRLRDGPGRALEAAVNSLDEVHARGMQSYGEPVQMYNALHEQYNAYTLGDPGRPPPSDRMFPPHHGPRPMQPPPYGVMQQPHHHLMQPPPYGVMQLPHHYLMQPPHHHLMQQPHHLMQQPPYGVMQQPPYMPVYQQTVGPAGQGGGLPDMPRHQPHMAQRLAELKQEMEMEMLSGAGLGQVPQPGQALVWPPPGWQPGEPSR